MDMLSLPPETFSDIAQHLDSTDALAFAQACKSSRSAGEDALWRTINAAIYGDRISSDQWCDSSFGKSECLSQAEFERRLVQLVSHLDEFPSHCLAVRSVRFSLSRPLSKSAGTILAKTAPRLRFLSLVGQETGSSSTNETDSTRPSISTPVVPPYKLIRSLEVQSSALRTLELSIGGTWEESVKTLLGYAQNLLELKLLPSSPYDGGWGDITHFPPPSCDKWPVLDRLQILTVEQIDEALVPLICHLLDGTKRLRKVILSDPITAVTPASTERIVKCLGPQSLLRELSLPWHAAAKLKLPFPALNLLSFEDSPAQSLLETVKAFVDHALSRDDKDDQDNKDEEPLFPLLERLYLHPVHCSSSDSFWRRNGDIDIQPSPVLPIPDALSRLINQSPRLLFVQQILDCRLKYTSDAWQKLRTSPQGSYLLVRDYVSASTKAFRHAHMYTSEVEVTKEHCIYAAQGVWEEFVDFGGCGLSAGDMGRAYQMMGESPGWESPGRGLENAALAMFEDGMVALTIESHEEEEVRGES